MIQTSLTFNRLLRNGAELRLNTKECCFICLKCTRQTFERLNLKSESDSFSSLSVLFRYLNINVEKAISQDDSDSPPQPKSEKWNRNITLKLCEDCSKINRRVVELVQIIEVVRMKIDYQVNSIQEKMRDAGRTPSRMIRYHRRMAGDPSMESIGRLRKQLSSKCDEVVLKCQPKVAVTRLASNYQLRSDPSGFQYLGDSNSEILDEESSIVQNLDFDPNADVEIEGTSLSDNGEDSIGVVVANNVKSFVTDTEQKLLNFVDIETSEVRVAEYICKTESEEPFESTSDEEFVLPVKRNNIPKRKTKTKNCGNTSGGLKCAFCGKFFKTKTTLRVHIGYTHQKNKQSIKCGICDKMFSSSYSASRHQKSVHCKKQVSCDVPGCGKVFFTRPGFSRHRRLEHPSEDKSATLPAFNANGKEGSSSGIKCSPGKSRIPDNKNISYCKICKKTYSNRYSLQVHHDSVHLGLRKFKCDHCEKRFCAKDNMKKHREVVHFNQRFNCTASGCNRIYSKIRNLRAHQKSAHPELTVSNKRNKTEVTDRECDICKKTYSSIGNLLEHRKIVHLGVWRFECEICHKKFSSVKDKNRHRDSVHLGIRHFCGFPGCGKNYSAAGPLMDHQRIVHRGWQPVTIGKNDKNGISEGNPMTTGPSVKKELV